MFGNNQLSKSRYRGGRSYAEVVAEDGIRSVVPLAAGKWARAGCFFVSTAGRAKWLQEQERLLVKGRIVLLRRWSPRENMFMPGKFRRGWLVLKGLPFHLWEVDQLKFILKKWGRVTEVARETVKLLDLTKVKLWVEMHPRVVLPALLEVEDGAWKHTVAVSVIGEEAKTAMSRPRHPTAGGSFFHGHAIRRSSTSMAAKRENVWEGSRLGFVEEVILGPTGPESSTKAHPVRVQKGRRSRGLHAGPDVPQTHDADASFSSPQREGSSAKATSQPRSGDERADVEANLGEDGRADEFQALISSNPSPSSEIEEESYGRRTVGCMSSGPSGLGQVQGGSMSSGLRYGSRERESAARKGKASMDQKEDFEQGEKTMDSREMWSKLFLPSADRRHGQQSSSENLPLRSAASFSEGPNLEVDGGTGSHQTRGIRESPIFRCLLPRNCNSWSKEETSTSRGVMESRKSQLKEDKGGFTGRVGYDPGSSSVTVSPSIPRTRGKDIIFGGNCEVPGVESLEVSQPFSSQPPEPYPSPSCNLVMNLPCPSGPHFPYSEILSQSPSVNQGKIKIFPEIGDVGPLILLASLSMLRRRIRELFFNQMSESSTPGKSSNLMPGSPGVNEASPPEDFLIDGLSPRKMAKVHEVLSSLDIKVYSRRKNRGP
ncbi:hypothetical protein CK203_025742 [Vitis vinifera]|uniref:Uncharacterized protein n=1 Tax=Vitis vinifera TaxID=29760 RepID=A0A438IGH5_VITVI|nr:hypothetical protein CK203_025742 [Vitis vinifera]